MSKAVATKPSTKRAPPPVIKPKSKAIGTLELKSSRMVFDDSTYAGKYVFNLTDNQLHSLKIIEEESLVELPDVTNRAWSINDYGNQLKITSSERLHKGTYDLVLKMSHWTMGSKSGFAYIVQEFKEVESSNTETLVRPQLKSLGCLL